MPKSSALAKEVKQITDTLSLSVNVFIESHKNSDEYFLAYNPLEYARKPFDQYIDLYASKKKETLFLGMNPGPFGMAQTGIPFGDIALVRDWLGVEAPVGKPAIEHPKRPIEGFQCPRSEVSGTRLWSWARDRFTTPDAFFKDHFVWNYCPLVFMKESGGNITPDKLSKELREELFEVCGAALRELSSALSVSLVIGIGKFAEKQASIALPDMSVSTILHPSPASPRANKNWVGEIENQLGALGVL